MRKMMIKKNEDNELYHTYVNKVGKDKYIYYYRISYL